MACRITSVQKRVPGGSPESANKSAPRLSALDCTRANPKSVLFGTSFGGVVERTGRRGRFRRQRTALVLALNDRFAHTMQLREGFESNFIWGDSIPQRVRRRSANGLPRTRREECLTTAQF